MTDAFNETAEDLSPAEAPAVLRATVDAVVSELPDIASGDADGPDAWTVATAVLDAVEPHYTIAALEAAADSLGQLAELNSRRARGTPEGPWIAAGVQGAALAVRRQVRALRAELESTHTDATKEH